MDAAGAERPRSRRSSGERREDVITAAWRTIEDIGIENTTLRAVARRLGSTTGVISHYFAEKDELLLCVLGRLLDMFRARGATDPDLAFSVFRDNCARLLPLDPESRSMWRIWTAFVGVTDGRSELAGEQEVRYNRARDGFARQFAHLQATGEIRGSLDPAALGTALLSLIDGIGIHYVIAPNSMSGEAQLRALDAFFDGVAAR